MRFRNILSVVSAVVATGIALPASATIVLVDPATLVNEAVVFPDGIQTGNTVYGTTAVTDTEVAFVGGGITTLRVIGADGQITGALITSPKVRTANFPELSFGLTSGGNFNDVSFDLFGGPATKVTFSIVDDGGTTFTFANLALGVGSNLFGFKGIAGETIASVSFLTNSTGLDYLQNIALTPVFDDGGSGSNVPEPATWALMITGFVMVGASIRRRRTSLAVSA